jgi:hypothetical protein
MYHIIMIVHTIKTGNCGDGDIQLFTHEKQEIVLDNKNNSDVKYMYRYRLCTVTKLKQV